MTILVTWAARYTGESLVACLKGRRRGVGAWDWFLVREGDSRAPLPPNNGCIAVCLCECVMVGGSCGVWTIQDTANACTTVGDKCIFKKKKRKDHMMSSSHPGWIRKEVEEGDGSGGGGSFRTAEERRGRWEVEGCRGGPNMTCVSVCWNVCGALPFGHTDWEELEERDEKGTTASAPQSCRSSDGAHWKKHISEFELVCRQVKRNNTKTK